MVIKSFPNIENADSSGLLCIGGDLEVESLLLAYSSGIFPWPINPEMLTWFAPNPRAVLFLDEFHQTNSLKKLSKKMKLDFKVNFDFKNVIQNCANSNTRSNKDSGTWITDDMSNAYYELHKAGYAHSFETYQNNQLIAGLYGVSVGAMFAGESMFFKVSGASKLTFCFLVEHLKSVGFSWIDCQVLNPLTESFGAKEIPRSKFMKLLEAAINKDQLL